MLPQGTKKRKSCATVLSLKAQDIAILKCQHYSFMYAVTFKNMYFTPQIIVFVVYILLLSNGIFMSKP